MKLIKIVDNETKKCEVALNENPDKEALSYYMKQGFIEGEYEKGYDGFLYVKGFAPEEPIEHKNEQIRQQRQARFQQEADPLYLDYVEAQAREDEDIDDKKNIWLEKKDEIRNDLPYVIEKPKTKKRKKASE